MTCSTIQQQPVTPTAGSQGTHLDRKTLVQHIVLQHKADALAGGLAVGLTVDTHCSSTEREAK